jgi:radical SAM superfamily enzyme YgiQ (UPF0313 family)
VFDDHQSLLSFCTRPGEDPDISLLNLNLMQVNLGHSIDRQAYLPLGLLYIAACLEREGHNVEFVDYQNFSGALSFDADSFVECLADPAPIVGISCMSNLLPFSIHVARKLKAAYPDRTIILGGVGPSPVAREIVQAFPFIDSVVEGEGELSILDIMGGRRDRHIPSNVPQNLDALPLPAYSLVDFDLYDAAPSIITSRGCPYRCAFCTEPYNFGGHSVRFRDIESVLQEMELIHEQSGRSMFLFQDDILPLDLARFRRLATGLKNLSFDVQWKCFGRTDLTTDEIMEEMAECGCVQIRYGIESGSNRTLERIQKGFTVEQAYDVAVKSLDYFPSVHASFIWGYPFEEVPEFEKTLRWVTRFEEAGITVLLFDYSPLPGSPLYQEHRERFDFRSDLPADCRLSPDILRVLPVREHCGTRQTTAAGAIQADG